MNTIRLLILGLLASIGTVHACPPAGWSRAELDALASREFKVEDAAARQSLALGLLPCLANPDPRLRDGIAFEALSTWMRGNAISPSTATLIVERLIPQLDPDRDDRDGFAGSFAALALSEAARMDRLTPYLSPRIREALAAAAANYLRDARDFRGFDEREGWRHGIAHGADLVLQLALNERVGKAELDRLLDALATKIAPDGDHFYVYGEPERLARAAFFLSQRQLHSAEEWRQWFERVSAPAPLPQWRDAYRSQRGLAKRHNTMAFLRALYLHVSEEDGEVRVRLHGPLIEALKRIG